jgi:dynein heavy chain
MLYLEETKLTWRIVVEAWNKTLPESINKALREAIHAMFLRFCPSLLELLRNNQQHRVNTEEKNIILGFLNIFDCHLSIFKDVWAKGKSEQELRPVLEGIFFFSCIWSLGGVCDRLLAKQFSALFYLLMDGSISSDTCQSFGITSDVEAPKSPYLLPVPGPGDIFAFQLVIHNKAEWIKWEDSVSSTSSLPRDVFAGNMIVPTLESTRYQYIMTLLLQHDKPFLLIGPSGTGKTVYIQDLIQSKLDKEKFAHTSMFFTTISEPVITQNAIMSRLDKRRKGVYGPPLGKKFVIFVDDINLPKKDKVNSQVHLAINQDMAQELISKNSFMDFIENLTCF